MPKVLVIREADDFSRILAENGYEVLNLPLIETKVLENLSDFEKKIARIDCYDGIFLTSAKAAQIFAESLREKNVGFGGKVYVLGKRSFEILKNENLDLIFDETANTAREMLEKISPEDLKGKRFLFVRGENSLRVVPEFLAETAIVDETIVYKTCEIAIGIDKLKDLSAEFACSEIVAACFFSPSAAEVFLEQFGAEILHQTKIATIGKTTAEYFETQNITVDFVAPSSKAKIFAESLSEHLKTNESDARKISGKT